MRRRRWLLFLSAALLLAAAAAALCVPPILRATRDPMAKENPDLRWWEPPRYLPAYGFLKPGAKLFRSTSRIIRPSGSVVFLRTDKMTRRLEVSGDLLGYVQIRSPQEALAYAEFLTSSWIRASLSDPAWRELRIAAPGDAKVTELDDDWKPGNPHRRKDGVLRQEEWEANGLSRPGVRRAGADFVVTRWLWTFDTVSYEGGLVVTDVVSLVAHQVAPDGRVTEKVLEKRKLQGVKIVTPLLR